MDELTRRRIHKRGATRRESIDTILDDLTIARGMVEEMTAEANQHADMPEVVTWLGKADDCLTAVVAAAERAK